MVEASLGSFEIILAGSGVDVIKLFFIPLMLSTNKLERSSLAQSNICNKGLSTSEWSTHTLGSTL
jgi:hypothetical protein